MQNKDQSASTVQQNYDYSWLVADVTSADHKAFDVQYGSGPKDQSWVAVVFLSIMFLIFATVAVIGARAMEPGGLFVLLLFLVVIGFAIGATVRHARRRKTDLIRLWRFANANGMSFACNQPDPVRAGMIFDEGRSRELTESLTLADGTELANYRYVTGSGKNQNTHVWGFVKIPLVRSLPHMVLDAKENNLLRRISNLPDTFDQEQTLSLEGDFNNYFTLYAPHEYERDALYVFTPDVMAALVDAGQDYDMEVIGKELYLYQMSPIDLMDSQQIQTMLKISSVITSELKDQSRQYADERVGDRAANIIAPQGARLKHGVNWFVIGAIVLYLGYQAVPALVSGDKLMLLPIVFPVIFGVIAVLVLIRKMKNGS